ncbi:MAG: hypothetical protein Kow0031_41340 [Anaerolineae bacterium]
MTKTVFLRQLNTPIEAKGEALAQQIAALNAGDPAPDAFTADPADFSRIPGSTFAYWVGDAVLTLFTELPLVESDGRAVRVGDHPGNQDRYIRLFWEIPPENRSKTRQWIPYQKGGAYSPYFADIYLVADWDLNRETYHDFYGRPGRSSIHPSNYQFFFRPGLTWPRRTTSGISIRPMPAGCVFADKGPAIFVENDAPDDLLALLAVVNSTPFEELVKLQLGAATAAARSYEVGVIQRTPLPDLSPHAAQLAALARESHDLTRQLDTSDETSHAFRLPGLVALRRQSLLTAAQELEAATQAVHTRLAQLQTEIDALALTLYGLTEQDLASTGENHGDTEATEENIENNLSDLRASVVEESDDDETTPPEDLPARVQNLLMWCVGAAFGRWDIRFALDQSLLPALAGPFDPLPRCAPGALVGPDGLPAAQNAIASESWLRARATVLDVPQLPPDAAAIPHSQFIIQNSPFTISWDGILVDDPTHPRDIVTVVRQALDLLWPGQGHVIEEEICAILGVTALRDYFRDPRKGFFEFHLKRYSKSRRKAPLYWLLQSERRNYSVWLYAHRLTRHSYYTVGREYADAKVVLEETRLAELRQNLDALDGSARRRREREIERQRKLVDEVTAFRNQVDQVAKLELSPDLNDGVLISMAPLRQLTPWKEVGKMWEKLLAGEYEWSAMSQAMRQRKIK